MVPRLGNSWETRRSMGCRTVVHILAVACRIPIPKWIGNFKSLGLFGVSNFRLYGRQR